LLLKRLPPTANPGQAVGDRVGRFGRWWKTRRPTAALLGRDVG
jgi:hypothetical protein